MAEIRPLYPRQPRTEVYYDSFRASIRAAGAFSEVDFDWALESEADVRIRPLYRCDLAEFTGGGFVPLYPMLTLGLIPQIVRGSYHWAFTIERGDQSVTIDCPIRGAFGMGWVPKILKATGSWTDDPHRHPNLYRRLSLEIARALAVLPPN